MCIATRHNLFGLRLAKACQIPKIRSATQITGYLCFDTVFNLSNSVPTDLEFRLRLRFWRRILILLPFREKLINQSQNKILQIFEDAYVDCGFSEMNLHHTFVKFLLFLLSPLRNLQKVIPTCRYF